MFTTGNSIKLCYTPWKYQDQKPRSLEIPDGIALEIPHAVSSVPLEIPCPQPPMFFFWNSPITGRERNSKNHIRHFADGIYFFIYLRF